MYGHNHHVGKVLEHLRSFTLSRNCFARQMAAPKLNIKWQTLMSELKERAVRACSVIERKNATCTQNRLLIGCGKVNVMRVVLD